MCHCTIRTASQIVGSSGVVHSTRWRGRATLRFEENAESLELGPDEHVIMPAALNGLWLIVDFAKAVKIIKRCSMAPLWRAATCRCFHVYSCWCVLTCVRVGFCGIP
jgi:hypothetical protein